MQSRLITLLHEFGSYEISLKRPLKLVEAANKLLEKIYSLEILSSLENEEIFDYYRKNLDKDKWKTQYGAMHSFQHYLMVYIKILNNRSNFSNNYLLEVH